MSFAAAASKKPSLLYVTGDECRDEPVIKNLAKTFEITVVLGQKEALKAYTEKTPDIIVTGNRLDNGTGVNLIELIREQNDTIPIAFFSGEDDWWHVRAVKAGATTVVQKPSVGESLKRQLQALVGAGQPPPRR
jgi:DNA-binding response OmpR family regulator